MTNSVAIEVLQDGEWWNWIPDCGPDEETVGELHDAVEIAVAAIKEHNELKMTLAAAVADIETSIRRPMHSCEFCANVNADCMKTGADCKPKWRGAKNEYQTPTNADRIRRMSDDELAAFLCDVASKTGCYGDCMAMPFCRSGHNGMVDWLKIQCKDYDDDSGAD